MPCICLVYAWHAWTLYVCSTDVWTYHGGCLHQKSPYLRLVNVLYTYALYVLSLRTPCDCSFCVCLANAHPSYVLLTIALLTPWQSAPLHLGKDRRIYVV